MVDAGLTGEEANRISKHCNLLGYSQSEPQDVFDVFDGKTTGAPDLDEAITKRLDDLRIYNLKIVGHVIYYVPSGFDDGLFVPKGGSVTAEVLAMMDRRPDTEICIVPVTQVPNWA